MRTLLASVDDKAEERIAALKGAFPTVAFTSEKDETRFKIYADGEVLPQTDLDQMRRLANQ